MVPPWLQTRSTERRKFVRRYVSRSHAHFVRGATRSPGHERLEAKEPGQSAPVKAASRRSRSRAAPALTGDGWPGKARQAIMACRTFDRLLYSARFLAALRSRSRRYLPHLASAVAQIIQIIWIGPRAAIRPTSQTVVRQPPHLALNQCADHIFRPKGGANASSLYLAIKRSMVCFRPNVRCPSLNCVQANREVK